MRRRFPDKNNNKAFTLAEALVAILIMLMVSSIMVAGIPAARDAYVRIVKVSNAELLLSTTASALRNEFTTAGHVAVNSENNEITYYNNDIGAVSKIYKASDGSGYTEGTLLRKQNAGLSIPDIEGLDLSLESDSGDYISTLVTDKATDDDLYTTFETVKYENGVVTFKNLQVKYCSNNQTIASIASFSIRVIEAD